MQCFENFGGNKCPPLVARLVAIVTGYVVTSQYDVIFKFANQRFGEVCWHNMHNKLRHLSSGRAGRAVKMMRAMETYKKQKNRYQLCLFLFNNNVDLKNNNRNIEKSFYLGARIAAINLFQVDLDKQWNYVWHCYEKAPPPRLHPFWKGRGDNPPTMPPFSNVPAHIFRHALSLLVVGYNVSP